MGTRSPLGLHALLSMGRLRGGSFEYEGLNQYGLYGETGVETGVVSGVVSGVVGEGEAFEAFEGPICLSGGGSVSSFFSNRAGSVLLMSLAMSMHFFGYEFARSATMALFTSKKTGFQSAFALPLTLAFVFPGSLVLLSLYARLLDAVGPRAALRSSTLFCSVSLLCFTGAVRSLVWRSNRSNVKLLVALLFVFREAYVQLLATQHWSFMGSVLNSSQGATWFGPIAGASSVSSAVAGYAIGEK